MLKLEFDLSLSYEELHNVISRDFHRATSRTAAIVGQRTKDIARTRLRMGLKHWDNGWFIEPISGKEGSWIIGVRGKLANWMEDGIQRGEISDALFSGGKVKFTKDNKKYIDVPMNPFVDRSADSISHKKTDKTLDKIVNATVSITSFKSADELSKHLSKKEKVKDVVLRNIEGITKKYHKNPKTGKHSDVSFLAIKRLTEDNAPWPKNKFYGAKALDVVDYFIELTFERSLRKLMGG